MEKNKIIIHVKTQKNALDMNSIQEQSFQCSVKTVSTSSDKREQEANSGGLGHLPCFSIVLCT